VAGQGDLQRWWDGLSEEEQAEAVRSAEADELSDTTQESLESAGLVKQGGQKDKTVPGKVRDFLKMRH
jgi:hypothetical protein